MTCKQILKEYLQNNEGFVKKVHLYAIAEDWSPETVGRELREMEKQGEIFVDYYDGRYSKNLAMYSAERPKQKKVEIINGKAVMMLV